MKRLRQIINESYTLLLEYDAEKTQKIHGEKALSAALKRTDEYDSYLSDVHGLYHGHEMNSHPGTNKEKAMHELFGQFEDADPTPNKKYVQHIARIYGHGGFNRHEDMVSRGHSALKKWDDLAKRKIIPAEHRDIGKIKSLSQMEDIIDQHSDKLSGKQEDKAHHEKMKGQADITEHGTFTHIIPHTKEASQHFGKGTRWCTAAEQNNMHDEYSGTGPLQMFVPKEPKHPGEKYQYHYSSDQLMDEKDVPKGSTGHNDIDAFIGQYRRDADNAHQSTAGFDHPEGFVRRRTLKQNWDRATEEQVGKVAEKGVFDHYSEDHYADSRPDLGKSPLDHPNLSEDDLTKLLDHPNWYVKASVLHSKKSNETHIDKVINDTTEKAKNEHGSVVSEVRAEAFSRTKNTKHLENAINSLDTKDEDEDAIEGAGRNPRTPTKLLSKLIRHPEHGWTAVANKNTSDEDLKWASERSSNNRVRDNAKYYLGVRAQQAAVAKHKKSLKDITLHTK